MTNKFLLNTIDLLNSSNDRGNLLTEKSNAASQNIDTLTTKELVKLFVIEDLKPQKALSSVIEELTVAIDNITTKIKQGGRLFYIGAGSSGRLGVLDAAECPPTFNTPHDLVQGIIAGGLDSMVNSSELKEDNPEFAISDLRNRKFSSKDTLLGISAGGTTPYVISALRFAKSIGALTIAMTSVPKEEVTINCDIDIRLITGPELISGSTRLKAGTATKMALNIISSGIMIKLGKVYGNKMVDLSVKNSKLLDRSLRILTEITDVSRDRALELLTLSKGSVKVSILMELANLDFHSAKKLLSDNQGNLRLALVNYL